jgi:pimeloyl-ACP methyl ester carboxylesterase
MIVTHRRTRLAAFGLALLGLFSAVSVTTPSRRAAAGVDGSKPTVVLVHGAFADASGWSGVIEELHGDGYPIIAPANPLRGLEGDADYLASILATIPGPVVLVGHSYGGAVITNAAGGRPNVKALVYIAAFAPDEGESVLGLTALYPGSKLPAATRPRPYALPAGGVGIDTYIDPDQFQDVFVGDVPAGTAAIMAASQRPLSLAAGIGKTREVAWKTIPSWYMVATEDHAIPPDAERFMARRARSQTVEVAGSHAVMVAHARPVADLIRSAANQEAP